jgi:trk system potassium uptake protein TrkA
MKQKAFAVLGLGSFGMGAANELMERGAEVLVVDRNERLIEENAKRFTQAVIADLTDPEAIGQLGLGSMDAVIVDMSQDLEASIMCVMVAKEKGVHRVIAKAENKRKSEILKKVGADQIVFPEQESGTRTAFQLMFPDILRFFDLTSDLVIVEMQPREEWCGRTLLELELRKKHGINVIAFRRGDKVYDVRSESDIIQSGESMLIVMTKDNLETLEA